MRRGGEVVEGEDALGWEGALGFAGGWEGWEMRSVSEWVAEMLELLLRL